ncbi:MAG TPA: hypothetical protein VIJ79_14735 [Acidobacteriaceae bacterium]
MATETEAVIPVRLAGSLLEQVSQDAARAGVSLESWFVSLAAERVRDHQVAERFFSRSPQESDGRTMLEILDSANDHPPMPGDELDP